MRFFTLSFQKLKLEIENIKEGEQQIQSDLGKLNNKVKKSIKDTDKMYNHIITLYMSIKNFFETGFSQADRTHSRVLSHEISNNNSFVDVFSQIDFVKNILNESKIETSKEINATKVFIMNLGETVLNKLELLVDEQSFFKIMVVVWLSVLSVLFIIFIFVLFCVLYKIHKKIGSLGGGMKRESDYQLLSATKWVNGDENEIDLQTGSATPPQNIYKRPSEGTIPTLDVGGGETVTFMGGQNVVFSTSGGTANQSTLCSPPPTSSPPPISLPPPPSSPPKANSGKKRGSSVANKIEIFSGGVKPKHWNKKGGAGENVEMNSLTRKRE